MERHVAVDRRAPGLELGVALDGHPVGADALDHRGEVLGRRAAATTDDVHPELGDEPLLGVGEL